VPGAVVAGGAASMSAVAKNGNVADTRLLPASGVLVVTCDTDSDAVRLWDGLVHDAEPLWSRDFRDSLCGVVFCPMTSLMVLYTQCVPKNVGVIKVWELANDRWLYTVDDPNLSEGPTSISFNPGGTKFLTSNPYFYNIRIREATSGIITLVIATARNFRTTYTPDLFSDRILALQETGVFSLYEAETGEVIRAFPSFGLHVGIDDFPYTYSYLSMEDSLVAATSWYTGSSRLGRQDISLFGVWDHSSVDLIIFEDLGRGVCKGVMICPDNNIVVRITVEDLSAWDIQSRSLRYTICGNFLRRTLSFRPFDNTVFVVKREETKAYVCGLDAATGVINEQYKACERIDNSDIGWLFYFPPTMILF
jgi:hypothetical protein